MKGSLLLYYLKLNRFIFFYRTKRLTDYIYTDIYRNALDRLRVHMNIILFEQKQKIISCTTAMRISNVTNDILLCEVQLQIKSLSVPLA